jgi:hypothetical protein
VKEKKLVQKKRNASTLHAGERSASLRLGSQIWKRLFLDTSPILTPTSENQKAKLFIKI